MAKLKKSNTLSSAQTENPVQAESSVQAENPAQAESSVQNEAQASPKQQTQARSESWNLAPGDIIFLPPLLQSFATLFRLLGKEISPNQLLSVMGASPVNPASCLRVVKQLGLQAQFVFKPSLNDISDMILPSILLLKDNKSCLLLGYEQNEAGEKLARVIFPEHVNEESSVAYAKLEEAYSGYAGFATLSASVDKQVSKLAKIENKHWFWDVIWHYLPMYRYVMLASVAVNLLALIGPLFFMNVYDRVVPNLAFETLWVLGVGVIIGYIFDFILRTLRNVFTDNASRNIDTVIATNLMQKILSMRLADRPASSGALLNNMREFEAVREFFSAASLLAIIDLPFLFLFVFIVSLIGGKLFIIPLVAIAILLIIIMFMQFSIKRYAQVNHQGNVEKNAHLVEMINGMEAIKTATAENRMLQIWEKVVGYTARNTASAKHLNSLAVNLALGVTQLVSVATIIWGVYLISEGLLTTGGLIAANILIGRSMSFVMQLAALVTRYQQTRIALTTLNALMALPSEYKEQSNTSNFGHLPASIELIQMNFTYKNSNLPAINNMDLKVKAGERVAIIGNMGSGKSTLVRLIAGLYEPDSGAVTFGGVDLRQLDVTELRTRIGFLSQNPTLFHGTIRENIALGYTHIPDQLVMRAAYLAGVTDFVQKHPAGFAMPVGERGENLSGGQKQTVALARALLHDPDVLILDEPTSNIDGATELKIKQRLKTILPGKTVFINMHRLSLLDLTTRVLIIENGIISRDLPTKDFIQEINSSSK